MGVTGSVSQSLGGGESYLHSMVFFLLMFLLIIKSAAEDEIENGFCEGEGLM